MLYCTVLCSILLYCILFYSILYYSNTITVGLCCGVQVKELIDAMDQDLKKSAASSSALEAAAYQVCVCECLWVCVYVHVCLY